GRKVLKVIAQEVAGAVEPSLAPRVERKLGQAADAFERDHVPDALRILRPLSKEAPNVPAVRELTGLAYYGTGQWALAAKELEAFRSLAGSVEQHPVLADCYRALKRYKAVAELWDELREASPGAALVTEGRIVAAGALADQGDVDGAIKLLEKGPVRPNRIPALHHARLWYALADLYERAGDAPKARELFARVVAVEPGLADAAERLAALG
ncbi:MAG: tetratricopeptide repeat protein, partial [Actinomycetota bacterium]|nr:tetratricopeptide repeat protein [Actinomycetota bacterium]